MIVIGAAKGVAGWQHKGEVLEPGRDFKVFHGIRCANKDCKEILADADGQPSWDLLGGQFVCRGGCGITAVPRAAPRPAIRRR